MTRHPRTPSPALVDTGEREAIAQSVADKIAEKTSMSEEIDGKIRQHKDECGKPLMADMRVVNDFRIEMNVHMRQMKWLLAAAIVSLLANNGIGKFLSGIVHADVRTHSSIESRDAGIPAGTAVALSSNK